MKKVAIYCRESTEKQDIDSLVSLCERQAIKLGFQEYKIYKDVKTGYSNERTEYINLVNDIKSREINVVITYESARLGRDELEHHILYKIFKDYGVKVYNMSHGWVDPNNEDDLFLEGLLNLLDAREGRKTARRVRDRMKEICQSGRWTGGPAPFGYCLKNKELFIDEEKATIVKEIFRLYLEGMPSSKIAAMYDFEPRQIRRMLSNPVYAGKLKYHQVRVENKKKIESKEYEVFDGIHEKIISEETFHIANTMIKNTSTIRFTYPAIFRNLLYCNCGNKLYPAVGYGHRTYRCVHNCLRVVYEDEVLVDVIESIENILNQLDLDTIDSQKKELEERIVFYKKNLTSLKTQIENLTRKYISEQISEELYDKLNSELSEKVKFATSEIEKLNAKSLHVDSSVSNKKIILKYLEKIKKEEDKDKMNQFFSLIIDKIVFINGYRFIIYMKI